MWYKSVVVRRVCQVSDWNGRGRRDDFQKGFIVSFLYKPVRTVIDRKTGRKTRKRSAKWYGRFRDPSGIVHKVPLCRDKDAAQTMLTERMQRADRGIDE